MATGDNVRPGREDEDRLMSGWATRKLEQSRFLTARDGDDLLISFECDFCVFASSCSITNLRKILRRIGMHWLGSSWMHSGVGPQIR